MNPVNKTMNFISDEKKQSFTYFIAEVYVDNGLLGEKFTFSLDDVKKLRLPKIFPYNLRYLSQKVYHNSLIIRPSTKKLVNGIPYGVPKAYLTILEKNKRFVDPRVVPVIGTVVFGKYKGVRFSLFGTQEIDNLFCRSSIQRVIRGERQLHRSCTFEHATHKDAIPLHGKLTEEIHHDLLTHKYLKKIDRPD